MSFVRPRLDYFFFFLRFVGVFPISRIQIPLLLRCVAIIFSELVAFLFFLFSTINSIEVFNDMQ